MKKRNRFYKFKPGDWVNMQGEIIEIVGFDSMGNYRFNKQGVIYNGYFSSTIDQYGILLTEEAKSELL
jgi:hypothetical protein